MAAKPFESKIQDLVYNVDVGIGLRLIKVVLYFLFVFVVMLLYTATQFHGLSDAEGMEMAQLGRNLAARGKLITQVVRPMTMWYLIEKSSKHNPMINEHPDVLHAPLWPAVLAGSFKSTRTSFYVSEKATGIYPPEYRVVAFGHVFTLLTGFTLFLMGLRLFDRRVALLSMTVYFLSDTVWHFSISGLAIPMATFLVITAFYWILIAGGRRQEEEASAFTWFIPFLVSLILCVLAFLTRYGTVVIVPAIALFIGITFRKNGWKWAVGFIIVFLIGISPWLARNVVVSGGPLGAAPYSLLNSSPPQDNDPFERSLVPDVKLGQIASSLKGRMIKNFGRFYKEQFRTVGDGILICLFITAFLYRFVRSSAHLLRWCAVLAMILLMVLASAYGESTIQLMHVFWPLIILYGFAFFFILLERLQLNVRLFNLAVTTAFVVVNVLPLIVTMMPPRGGIPYPPYFPPFITHVCGMLNQEEMICTDMPWATAWYGNRISLLLPSTLDDFYTINDYTKRISALYFTTITRDKPYVQSLLTGPDKTWFPILEGRIPPDFPLKQGFPLNNMDQLFLTDRVRWDQPSQ